MPRTRRRWGPYVISFILGFIAAYFAVAVLPAMNWYAPLPVQSTSASVPIVAVSGSGDGVLGSADIEISQGKGRVLINTNPFIEPDTQFSAETAVAVAQEYTKKSLQDRDVILTFTMPEAQVVGGPSAGAAMTTAVIAAVEGKSIREGVGITGTIEEDGTIGSVGGILEKAQASAENGIKLFLVPKGQGTLTYYEKKVEERRQSGFVFQRIRYVPVKVDLNNITMSEYGMQVREVSTIGEAVQLLVE